MIGPGLGENWRLVTDGPLQFKKEQPVEVGYFKKIIDHLKESIEEYISNE